MTDKDISIVIPAHKPDINLNVLLKRLEMQDCRIKEVFIINTDEKYFDESLLDGLTPEFAKILRLIHIEKKNFDHGGTRNYGMSLASGELVLFMTQDALPKDRHLIRELARPFSEEDVYVSYARQLPRAGCDIVEQYTRSFNYPDQDIVKDLSTLQKYGIKNYFCSDVCAMYHREKFIQLGGFPAKIIFNEDMVYSCTAMKNGGKVFYASQAKVIHSHNYTCMEQLRRNFDNGVSQSMHPEVFDKIISEGEGMRMVVDTAKKLIQNGYFYKIPRLLLHSGFKYVGFRLGKGYTSLSRQTINRLTSNTEYWKYQEKKDA